MIKIVMPEYVKRVYGEDKRWHWNPDCPDYPIRGKETVLMLSNTPKGVVCPKCLEVQREAEDNDAARAKKES